MGNTSVTTKILRFLGTEKGLLTMSAIVALYAFVYQIFYNSYIFFDTKSYFDAYDNLIKGELDPFRTPIYPLFIGLIRSIITIPYCYMVIILIQIAVFIVSVHYFYQITSTLKNNKIAYWLTFIYGIIPVATSWTSVILTESLAISGSIFYLSLTISAIKTGKIKNIWFSSLLMLLLVMLRPSFIYLMPTNIFMFIINNWNNPKDKRLTYNGLIGSSIVAIIFCGYCYKIKQNYGIFSPSGVTVINKYMVNRANDSFNVLNVEDNELRHYIDSIQHVTPTYHPYYEASLIIKKFGYKKIKEVLSNQYTLSENIKMIKERIYKASRESYNTVGIVPFTFFNIITPNMGTVFLLIIIFTYIILIYAYNNKKFPLVTTLILLYALGNIVITVVGATEDFGRLFLSSYPAVLLLTGILIQMIKDKSFLKNEFEE